MSTKTKPEPTDQHPTVIDEPEAKVAALIAKRVTHTPTGLIIEDSTPYEEWEEIHNFYSTLRDRTAWMIGDILRFGETKFGERYAQAIEMYGKKYQTLANLAYVCTKFADLGRRHEDLPFSWHEACASLLPQQADAILAEAKRKQRQWDRDDIRDAAAKAKGLPTKAERDAAKAAKEAKKQLTEKGGKTCETSAPADHGATPDTTAPSTVSQEKSHPSPSDGAAESDPQPAPSFKHGTTCEKRPHTGTGYLHAEDEDTPYDVDGVAYCGRCHCVMPAANFPHGGKSPQVIDVPMQVTVAPATPAETPQATQPDESASEVSERLLRAFTASIPALGDVTAWKPLEKKRWLMMLLESDKLIDALQK